MAYSFLLSCIKRKDFTLREKIAAKNFLRGDRRLAGIVSAAPAQADYLILRLYLDNHSA